MNLQFIADSNGITTGVYIPIKDWDKLKNKYKGIEEVEVDVTSKQMNEVRKRLKDYEVNPGSAMIFEEALDDIEKDL
jgi:hypothetical protein